ncbi:MAG: hypothetical protein WC753_01630 [Candidatus Gracilibacteria bacterium]|jgi:hypothetical protein
MLRTIAYIIFLCTGIFAFSLIVLFFRSQSEETPQIIQRNTTSIASTKTLDIIKKAYTFASSSQKDIFGVSVFRLDVDIKTSDRIRMYIFHDDYITIKKNLSLLSSIYTFSEVDEPFGKVFFLNDKNTDNQIVRFVTDIDGTVLGFEVLKDEYNKLRGLLSQ